jgi:transposase
MEPSTTIGMDVGDKYCQLYVLDNATGDELEQARVATTPAMLRRWFESGAAARVVLEVGSHAGWISRLLAGLEHEVLVADPRKARKLMGDEDKDDRLDAELLARFGRADPKLLKPVKLRGEQTQCALAVVRSRDSLVGARTKLINHVRGAVKAIGQRLPKCSAEHFHRMRGMLPEALGAALEPLMVATEALTEQIRQLERRVDHLCEAVYPQTKQLQQIGGVGPITALTYVLTLEAPERFDKSRRVGAYLGLCPRRWQSGDADPELRISKAGDAMLRRLLIQCAHYVIGPFGPDSDLRRWGLQYAARGGKAAKKRATVGVARRLAVLMHRLWVTGAPYEPLYNSARGEALVAQA